MKTDDKTLLEEFWAQTFPLEVDRRSELSYMLMQQVVQIVEEKEGWNLSKLADKIGVNRSQVSRWLNGSANVRLDTIARIEAALETPIIEVNRDDSVVFARAGFAPYPPAGMRQAALFGNHEQDFTIDYSSLGSLSRREVIFEDEKAGDEIFISREQKMVLR